MAKHAAQDTGMPVVLWTSPPVIIACARLLCRIKVADLGVDMAPRLTIISVEKPATRAVTSRPALPSQPLLPRY